MCYAHLFSHLLEFRTDDGLFFDNLRGLIMPNSDQSANIEGVFTKISDELDISEAHYEDAVAKYEAVGRWLDANDSPLHVHMPRIYAQGSFRLGTVVKPLSGKDEYDIDLVCHLEIDKKNISQEELRNMVGDRLKAHKDYKRMVEGGRRCWTLHYADAFHMDILPAIPDYEKMKDSIWITDKQLRAWQPSNPKGYARWFREQMKGMFAQHRQLLAGSLKANVEDVPEWKVKAPLQRAIQILKRHRDIHFEQDKDDQPVSIIITTLAGHAYAEEDNICDALVNLVDKMPNHILVRNCEYWVPNPTNPEENFADKWNEYPARREKFLAWLAKAGRDFEEALELGSPKRITEVLQGVLGDVGNLTDEQTFATTTADERDEYPEVRISRPVSQWLSWKK